MRAQSVVRETFQIVDDFLRKKEKKNPFFLPSHLSDTLRKENFLQKLCTKLKISYYSDKEQFILIPFVYPYNQN